MQSPQRCSEFSSKFWKGNPQEEQQGGEILNATTLFQQLLQILQSLLRDRGAEQRKHLSG
jgi:hypothetical protein